jgi:hypothetical protein
MLRSMLRALQCRQIYLNMLSVSIAGASGTPAAGGLDANFISSITDNGVGDYTINFKDIAQRDIAILGIHCATTGLYARVSAVTTSSVRVLVKTFAGVATDGDVNLSLAWHGSKHLF